MILTGRTGSEDFPITSDAIFTRAAGDLLDKTFLAIISEDETSFNLVYSTYFGHSEPGSEYLTGISLDQTTGETLILSGLRPKRADPEPNITIGELDSRNGFVSRFSLTNYTLLDTVYFGGIGAEHFYYNKMDNHGNIILVGSSKAASYPLTSDCWSCSNEGEFDLVITKLKYSTTPTSTAPGVSGFEWLVLVVGLSVYYFRRTRKE